MEPISTAALISAGAGLATAGTNIAFNAAANKKQRAWSEKMYAQQRDDNIRFWEMQNQYNSPANMMRLYQEAGLNENLIYGSAGSSMAAEAIKTPDVQPYNVRTPDVSGVGDAIQSLANYQNFDIRAKQIQSLELDNEYKAIRNITEEFDQGIRGLDYSRKKYMFENNLHRTQLQYAEGLLRKQDADTRFTLDENARREMMKGANLQESIQRALLYAKTREKSGAEIQNINQALQILKEDTKLKIRENELERMGISKNSPAYFKIVGQMINILLGMSSDTK